MSNNITSKDILKQLTGHYSSYIFILLIITAILGFCTVFCGTQLEWTHPLSMIGIAVLSITFVIFLIIFFKIIKIKDHYIFRRYGSAEIIAETINQGKKVPRYIRKIGTNSSTLIITDKFIVSTSNYRYYLELRDARYMQLIIVPETKPIILSGNPIVSTAATVGVNYASKKFSSTPNYDFLMIWDDEGVRHEYNVRSDEAAEIMRILIELAPQIEIKEAKPL